MSRGLGDVYKRQRLSSYRFGRKESVAIAGMIELYREGTNNTYLE